MTDAAMLLAIAAPILLGMSAHRARRNRRDYVTVILLVAGLSSGLYLGAQLVAHSGHNRDEALVALIISAAFMTVILILDVRPPRPGRCPGCDYRLQGLTSSTCPECGGEVGRPPPDLGSNRWSTFWVVTALLAALAVVAAGYSPEYRRWRHALIFQDVAGAGYMSAEALTCAWIEPGERRASPPDGATPSSFEITCWDAGVPVLAEKTARHRFRVKRDRADDRTLTAHVRAAYPAATPLEQGRILATLKAFVASGGRGVSGPNVYRPTGSTSGGGPVVRMYIPSFLIAAVLWVAATWGLRAAARSEARGERAVRSSSDFSRVAK